MSAFIDEILNGDIETLLGAALYAETISKVVIWWAVLPMIGIILSFCGVLWALLNKRG